MGGRALSFAAAVFVAGIAAAFYRSLPSEDRAALLTRRAVRRSAFWSVSIAIAVSCTYWYAGWYTPALVPRFLYPYWRVADWIPSAFSLLLPGNWRSGFHQYFSYGTYCFPGEPWWESMRYLRAAIPAYGLTSFIALLGVRMAIAALRSANR